MDKALLRQRLQTARSALTVAERQRYGQAISAALFALPVWQAANLVACYLSLPDEVPTQPVIQAAWRAGKRVAAPVTNLSSGDLTFHSFRSPEELRAGPLGILQPNGNPVPLEQIDLMVVPGVGFDLKGNRLGFGRGFYDRVLTAYRGPSIGLAFEVQLVTELPVTPRDRPVDQVLTEQRILPEA
jgi:5-formyltetrahydrofolate cyclo-ligase